MIFRFLFSLVAMSSLMVGQRSEGSAFSEVISCAGLVFEVPVKALMVRLPASSTLQFQRQDGKQIHLKVGRRLGQGWVGTVLEVESVQGQLTDLSGVSGPVVAKVPNQIRGIEYTIPKARNEIRREWNLYLDLKRAFPDIQRQLRFPKFTGWSPLQAPVVPILGIEETTKGPILFKPMVSSGSFLKDIAKRFEKNQRRLPSEMEESLFQIYEFLQVAGKALKMWPDARPANLVWISDPKMMAQLGFERPSFALIEFSTGPFPIYTEPFNSYTGFRREFINLLYLELLKEKSSEGVF